MRRTILTVGGYVEENCGEVTAAYKSEVFLLCEEDERPKS
jgi:hypothetical protein